MPLYAGSPNPGFRNALAWKVTFQQQVIYVKCDSSTDTSGYLVYNYPLQESVNFNSDVYDDLVTPTAHDFQNDALVTGANPSVDARLIEADILSTETFLASQNGWRGQDGQGAGVTAWAKPGAFNVTAYLDPGESNVYLPQGFICHSTFTHEFIHGVTGHTSGLMYADESGALNESYSDILSYLVYAQDDINAHTPAGSLWQIPPLADNVHLGDCNITDESPSGWPYDTSAIGVASRDMLNPNKAWTQELCLPGTRGQQLNASGICLNDHIPQGTVDGCSPQWGFVPKPDAHVHCWVGVPDHAAALMSSMNGGFLSVPKETALYFGTDTTKMRNADTFTQYAYKTYLQCLGLRNAQIVDPNTGKVVPGGQFMPSDCFNVAATFGQVGLPAGAQAGQYVKTDGTGTFSKCPVTLPALLNGCTVSGWMLTATDGTVSVSAPNNSIAAQSVSATGPGMSNPEWTVSLSSIQVGGNDPSYCYTVTNNFGGSISFSPGTQISMPPGVTSCTTPQSVTLYYGQPSIRESGAFPATDTNHVNQGVSLPTGCTIALTSSGTKTPFMGIPYTTDGSHFWDPSYIATSWSYGGNKSFTVSTDNTTVTDLSATVTTTHGWANEVRMDVVYEVLANVGTDCSIAGKLSLTP